MQNDGDSVDVIPLYQDIRLPSPPFSICHTYSPPDLVNSFCILTVGIEVESNTEVVLYSRHGSWSF
jgi:hypothetical protein